METLVNFMHFVLAVAWSFAFLGCLADETRLRFRRGLRHVATEVDLRVRTGRATDVVETLTVADAALICTRSGIRPSLLVDLPGMVVVHKPTDWEVDGVAAGSEAVAAHPPLSAFMQSVFPKEQFPLVWTAEHSYGFLHRLDIPSSGLVLAGTSFEGYYWLRLQLDTQLLRREYVVVCEGLPPASLGEVVARVDVAPEPTQRRSINDSGKPAETSVCMQAHLGASEEAARGRTCVVAIRIRTGRRHQIRAHMRHSGHPTLADARYTCREALLTPTSSTPSGLPSAGQRGPSGSGGGVRRWTYNALAGQP